jgi:hypothetical protein
MCSKKTLRELHSVSESPLGAVRELVDERSEVVDEAGEGARGGRALCMTPTRKQGDRCCNMLSFLKMMAVTNRKSRRSYPNTVTRP